MIIKTKQPIHVVFTADENYARHLGVSMLSLLNTRNTDIPLRISIIGDNLSEKSIDRLTWIADNYNAFISFPKVDFDVYTKLGTIRYFSRATYGSFAIPDIIDEDKVLFLDIDILVRSDISRLWDIDISEYYIGAVVDAYFMNDDEQYAVHNRKLRMLPGGPYFNSGIQLMNLKKCRQGNFAKKAIEFKLQYPDTGWCNQDAFNAVLWGKWLSLHTCWNVQTRMFRMYNAKNQRSELTQEVIEGVENPAIVHFTEGMKPWHCEGVWPYEYDYFWPYFEEYYKYASMSPWKSDRSKMSVLMGTLRKHRRKFKIKLRHLFDNHKV